MNGSEAVLQVLRGVVVNCRAGAKTQRPKECIVQFADVRSFGQAAPPLGKKVVWSVGKREIIGKIVAVHGKNGLVRVRFRKGLPGQNGVQIKIIG